MNNAWIEQIQAALIKQDGDKKGKALFAKYKNAFSVSYQDYCSVKVAVMDIHQIEKLSTDKPFQIDFYEPPTKTDRALHLRLFQFNNAIPLSDMLPILDNLGLRTFDERPYTIKIEKTSVYISDFTVALTEENSLDIEVTEPIFQEAFTKICLGLCENDGFNKLVLAAQLTWREIGVLRAYAKYLHQASFRFSQAYIEKILVKYSVISKDLVSLFELKNNPAKKSDNAVSALEKKITAALDAITSLDDDKVMRRFFQLIQATLRTNYFQIENGEPKAYLSFKFKSSEIPELPLPHPLFEIFVYSPRFEAIHLRSAKVARGGIRWSDRREDFRTEVLGLMKAQKVKNSIIIPSGAKGGFVLKALPLNATREQTQAEVIACYKAFMHGLLDLTDNIKNNKVIRPKNVVCHDEEDPYLVVAADKGTSSFSDIANSISKEYQFWLGDAFASGGSEGYDHKKMGITARGAWESIKRHFRELNRDINDTKAPVHVVGIGDMSGDVFGNGMIYSSNVKLLAAFDHRDIFIDPDPNPEKSYKERVRLFNLPTSSWQNYNAKLISKGGGVFKRSEKTIPLSAEIKKILDVKDNSLSPNDLIKAILKAPVDLLFNGGIGTYVKSSYESDIDVRDKTNDFCRVNGDDLRCLVVGEGGNLGFTQLGRIEYALQGGLINTDSIDNSAGVDCSDHEVNIKILLDAIVAKGNLTEKKRNQLLQEMTEEVAALVLKDNYSQALTMSFSALSATRYVSLYQAYLKELETTGVVDRAVEFLPDDKTILERKAAGKGFTRPELSILLAYSKIHIESEILKSHLPEDPYYIHTLVHAFPKKLAKPYHAEMPKHRLWREIIATQLSNQIVNEMGITFVYRAQTETGASVPEIIKAHTISSHIFDARALDKMVDSLGTNVAISLQYELLHYVRTLLNLSTRWFLRSQYLTDDIGKTVEHFSVRIRQLEAIIPSLMTGVTKEYLSELINRFVQHGFSEEIATRIAVYRALYTSLNIIEVSTRYKFDLIRTAKVYFAMGSQFNLVWFRDQISADSREGHWNTLARLTLRDELDGLQKMLTVAVMHSDKKEANVKILIKKWIEKRRRPLERWEKILHLLHSSEQIDYTMFFIALRELAGSIRASDACCDEMI